MNRVACLQGSFQSEPASKICNPCEAGKFQANPGHAECNECPEGYFCPTGTVTPIECGSIALFCPSSAGLVQPATEGHYTLPATEDALRTRHSQQMCEPGYACVGGVKTSCEAGLTYQVSWRLINF